MFHEKVCPPCPASALLYGWAIELAVTLTPLGCGLSQSGRYEGYGRGERDAAVVLVVRRAVCELPRCERSWSSEQVGRVVECAECCRRPSAQIRHIYPWFATNGWWRIRSPMERALRGRSASNARVCCTQQQVGCGKRQRKTGEGGGEREYREDTTRKR